jgi:hypothetical protein
MSDRTRFQLTEHEALNAMREYLLLHRDHKETPAELALDLYLEADGTLTDSAVWIDWISCIRKAKGDDGSHESAALEEIATLGQTGPGASMWAASKRIPGTAEAILVGLRDPSVTESQAVTYLRALAEVGGELTDLDRERLGRLGDTVRQALAHWLVT